MVFMLNFLTSRIALLSELIFYNSQKPFSVISLAIINSIMFSLSNDTLAVAFSSKFLDTTSVNPFVLYSSSINKFSIRNLEFCYSLIVLLVTV